MRKYIGLLIAMVFLTGCMTTRQPSSYATQQMQMKMINLEKRLEEREKDIVDLRYEIKELVGQLNVDTASDDMDYASVDQDVDTSSSDESAKPTSKPSVKTTPPATKGTYAQNKDLIIRVSASAKQVQTGLKNSGFYFGKIDGKVGPQTIRAIEQFQQEHGLVADGIVGPKTWKELESYLKEG